MIPSARNLFDWVNADGSIQRYFFEGLIDPRGLSIGVDYDVPGKKGFAIKGVPLPEPGSHRLRVGSTVAGGFTAVACMPNTARSTTTRA